MPIKTQNLFKLFTKEDNTNIHKILGIFSVINFIFQYSTLILYGEMHMRNSKLTPYILAIHGLLSISSLIFHVPLKRHGKLPMIYKEFRLHSIVFGLRSVLCAYCFYYKLHILTNMFIVFLTMIAADIVTRCFAAETQTMRGMPFGESIEPEEKKLISRMQSSQQFSATMFMITNIEGAFLPLFAIQIAAFLMTLVRKNIISELDWHRVYSVSLWINIFVFLSFRSIGMIAYVISSVYFFGYFRIVQRENKYVLWYTIFLVYLALESWGVFDAEIPWIILVIIKMITIYNYLLKNIKLTKKLWLN